jgi:nitrogen regulatory protein P-II 1
MGDPSHVRECFALRPSVWGFLSYSRLGEARTETVVVDSMAESVVEAIIHQAATGQIGDGKIFLSRVEDAIRIRTAEHGDIAVS